MKELLLRIAYGAKRRRLGQRFLSFLLAAVLLSSCFVRLPVTANAQELDTEDEVRAVEQVEATALGVSVPTETAEPVETPASEETPKPEETPAPAENPASEETPAPVETPKPEETPAPAETPKPEETPALVEGGDPTADVENYSDWEKFQFAAKLTGEWARDLVTLAISQLGYTESANNYIVTDGVRRGYTRYGDWYGDPYGEWDAMFVAFCLNFSLIPETSVSRSNDVARWAEGYLKSEALHTPDSDYEPKPGDLAFFCDPKDPARTAVRMGVVTEVSDTAIKTIEGGGKVHEAGYERTDLSILGYYALPENPNYVPPEENQETEPAPTPEKAALQEQTVTPELAGNTTMDVAGLLPEDCGVEASVNTQSQAVALDANSELLLAVDFNIYYDNGETFAPEQPLTVTITDPAIAEAAENSALSVLYVSEDGEAKEVASSVSGDAITFQADAAGTHAVTRTVKQSTVAGDGRTYEITVTYSEDSGIPADAELVVRQLGERESSGYLEQTAAALGTTTKAVSIARAFDIKLVKDGQEYHSVNGEVQVSIQLLDTPVSSDMQIVHIGDTPENVGASVEGDTLSFATSGFSVYIVAQEELMQRFVFLNVTDDVTLTDSNRQNYIFNEQVLINGESVVQPATPSKNGAVFSGWVDEDGNAVTFPKPVSVESNIPSSATTQEEKQTWLNEHPTYFYAAYEVSKTLITFYNQSGLVVEKQEVVKPASGTTVFDTTKVKYVPIQDKEGTVISFRFWTEDPQGLGAQVSSAAGTGKLQIDASSPDYIDLYPYLDDGHYLYLDSNKATFGLSSADYIPPETVINGSSADDVLNSLNGRGNHAVPTSPGYTFTGWFLRKGNVAGATAIFEPVTVTEEGKEVVKLRVNTAEYNKLLDSFGNLPNNPTLYAHWEKNTTAKYTVILWRQKLNDAGTGVLTGDGAYAFAESFELSGSTENDITLAAAYRNQNTRTSYNSLNSQRVLADGTHPANIANDNENKAKNPYYGFTFKEIKATNAAAENANGSFRISSDGSTVLNVYYDRNIHTMTFWDTVNGAYYAATTGNNGTQYGLIDGEYRQLTRNSVTEYYLSRYNYNGADQYTGTIYDANSNVVQNPVHPNTYYRSTRARNQLYWLSRTGYVYTYNGEVYTGTRYVQQTGNHIDVVYTITAPYGADISDQFPIVGTNGKTYTEERWKDRIDVNNDNSGYVEFAEVTAKLFTMPDNDIKFVVDTSTRGFVNLYYYTQVLPGQTGERTFNQKQYSQYRYIHIRYGYVSRAEDYYEFTGFTQAGTDPAFSADNTALRNHANEASMYFYYDRESYSVYFKNAKDNTTVSPSETYLFEAPIADYNEESRTPVNGEMKFTGWYLDAACSTRVFFTQDSYNASPLSADKKELLTAMPAYDIVLYAGWTQVKYRATLIPNGGSMEGQAVGFNLESEEKITLSAEPTRDYIQVEAGTGAYSYDSENGVYSLTAENNGDYNTKPGAYVFQGWYEAEMTDDTTHVETYEKDGETRYRYVQDGTPRFENGEYVTKSEKFDLNTAPNRAVTLVALWQRAGGFRVQYNVVDSTLGLAETAYKGVVAPEDPEEYIDGSHALVLPSVGAPKGYTLDHWVDQNGNSYMPNQLVAVRDSNATMIGDDMVVMLEARYRPYTPTERAMADYTFMTNVSVSGGTASFVSDYSEYTKQRISVNEELKAPITPQAPEGYAFRGWYLDKEGTRKFDGFGVITNPTYTTLYAVFDKSFVVTYYLTDATSGNPTNTVIATQTYRNDGDNYQKLDTRRVNHPLDLDHYVSMWVSDWAHKDEAAYQYPYNTVSTKDVRSDLSLYAVLKSRVYLQFDSCGGSYVPQQEVPDRSYPIRPDDPTRDGYMFLGWFTQEVDGVEYDFDRYLSELAAQDDTFEPANGTLYAHWQADGSAEGTMTVIWWAETADGIGKYEYQRSASVTATIGETITPAKLNQLLSAAGENSYDASANLSQISADERDFFAFSADNSDASVVVDDNEPIFNVRFDRVRYTFRFDVHGHDASGTNNNRNTQYGTVQMNGSTYSGTDYQFEAWLGKEISQLWPVVNDKRDGVTAAKINKSTTPDGGRFWRYYPQGNAEGKPLYGIMTTATAEVLQAANSSKVVTFYMNAVNNSDSVTELRYYLGNTEETSLTNRMDGIAYGTSNTYTTGGDEYTSIFDARDITGYEVITDASAAVASDLDGRPGFNIKRTFEGDADRIWGRLNTQSGGTTVEHTYKVYSGAKKTGDTTKYYIMNPGMFIDDFIEVQIVPGSSRDRNACYSVRDANGNVITNATIYYVANGAAPVRHHTLLGRVTRNNTTALSWDGFINRAVEITERTETESETITSNSYFVSFFYQKRNYEIGLFLGLGEPYTARPSVSAKFEAYVPEVLDNADIPTPPAPEPGLVFDCWSRVPDTAAPFNENMPASNISLYATWKPVTYTVTTVGVDSDNDGDDDTYTATYGQQLREMNIPNPVMEGELFKGWLNTATGNQVTSVYEIVSDLDIEPTWTDLATRKVQYKQNFPAEAEAFTGAAPSAPVDGNSYVLGAKVIIKDGGDLYINRKDIDGNIYRAGFAFWEDAEGTRYYPGMIYTFRNDSPETLVLNAVYSEYRESILLYDKNTTDAGAKFILNDGTETAYTNLTNGQVRVLYRDEIRSDFNTTDMIVNEIFPVGRDQDGVDFTVTYTDAMGNKPIFAGWATKKDDSVPLAQNGDKAYVNTIKDDDGVLRNTLYAVWGICKIVHDGEEHVFPTIQAAVDYAVANLSGTAKIEMLMDYVMSDSNKVNIPAGSNITLTTAATTGDDVKYKFRDTFDNKAEGDRGVAIIKRGFSSADLFTVNGSFTTQNIIFDGASSDKTGRAISVTSSASLTVKGGTTFRNFSVTGNNVEGGAIYSEADVKIQTNSGETVSFSNCSSASEGGAISLNTKKLTIENAGTLSFENCSGTVGGAICTDTAGEMAVANSGTLQFNNCTSSSGQYGGGAIWTGVFSAEDNSGSLSFTNCSAANGGGAICANRDAGSSDTFVLTNTSIGTASFVNCSSGGSGGAIRVANGIVAVTSENAANPIRFENCTSSNSEGGAIYQGGGSNLTLRNVRFGVDGDPTKACSGKDGGAVYSKATGSVELTNVEAYGKGSGTPTATTGSGGAIYVSSAALTVNGGEFKDLAAKANGGAIYASKNLTVTGTAVDNVVFENCAAGSNGGAIYQGGEAMTLTNVTFGAANTPASGCTAALEGGCVYSKGSNATLTDCNFYYGIAGDADKKSRGGAVYSDGSTTQSTSLSIYGCVFDHCSAQTTSGTQAYGNGGAVYVENDTVLTIDKSSSGRRSSFTDCFAHRFGGAVMYEQNGGTSVSISNTDFTGCYTEIRGGGAVCTDSNQTTIDNCTFKGCYDKSSSGGGAIQLHPDNGPGSNPSVSISNSTFEDCYTANGNGGAIYGASGNVPVILENVSINGHTTGKPTSLDAGTANAKQGGAVYSKGNLTIQQSGTGTSSITGCTASNANGGAVNVAFRKAIYFEGNVVVYGNPNSNDGTEQKNVVLDQNYNTTINTTAAGIGAGAQIGIYVTGAMSPEADPYKSHGGPGDPFGTYAEGGSTENFDKFVNDRNGLTGMLGSGAKSEFIVWNIDLKLIAGQEFREFEVDPEEEQKIGCDSAYTVRTNAEATSFLVFRDESGKPRPIPANTTILLCVDDSEYYAYRATEATSAVPLSAFSKMGGSGKPTGSFVGQFIIDFSQTVGGMSLGKLVTGLSDTADGDAAVSGTVTIVATANFSLIRDTAQDTTENDLRTVLNAGYQPSAARATAWDNRDMALVIEKADGLPIDARLKVKRPGDAQAIEYRQNVEGSFIIPLGDLKNYSGIEIELVSDYFPRGTTAYSMTAKLMVANSKEEAAPLNGWYNGSASTAAASVTFKLTASVATPSLKITTAKTAYGPGETVTVNVDYRNISNEYLVEMVTETRTKDTQYANGTAAVLKAKDAVPGARPWTQTVSIPASFEDDLTYRVTVTVKDGSGNAVQVAQYYFLAVQGD